MRTKGRMNWGVVEEEAGANWLKCDFPLIVITFDSNWWYFIYHSRHADKPTGTLVTL